MIVFDIANVPDFGFDLVRHIDLHPTTVTIATGLTDSAMRNFNTSSWDYLRTAIMTIPLYHPFWRISLYLWNKTWLVEWDRLSEFETRLTSIEA